MAVLSKIRERSMFLIIIIGLALFAFVLDPSTLGDFFNSSKVNEIGEINGESISRQEFAAELEAYKQQAGNRVSEMQASKTVWDNMVRKKIYQNQLSEAGITVGEADVWAEVINAPSVNSNPQFQNEAGLFDEAKFKQFLADTKENNPQMWGAWSNYMNQIRDNAERNTYNNLVTAGLGSSLKEGEFQYFTDNTKLNAQFVYVPYTSIADSLVSVSKEEIASYIKENSNDFKVEESRDISYVKFDITATEEDENAIKAELYGIIEDFKNITNDVEFLSENDSDTSIDDNFKFENAVNKTVASAIFSGVKGDVFGPYKDQGFFKISKITSVAKMPDSAKASHILIPFIGAQRVAPDVTRTEDEAKKLADSLLNVVKRRGSKFASLAKEFSSDKGSAEKGGTYDWFNYNRMTPAFRDFAFEGKKGDIGVVKTPFGFHVIKVDGQKNNQTVVKLATFGRKIVASETTENAVFQKAEQFALATSKDKKFFAIAKENKYVTKPAIGLKVLDENVPGLGNERQIVSWAFGNDTKPGDFKRFDLEGSHVVAFVTAKTEKGLMSAAKATNRVKPTLINEKKAKLIADKFNGSALQDIAKENNTSVRNGNGVTLKSPTLSGAGSEPKVVGAMFNAELNKVYKNIEGNRGVYAFTVTNKELPTALPNYEAARKSISDARKNKTFVMYEAIKKASEIEDNRSSLYVGN
ncbi:peptidylprolyl isomerase [Polaribacter sp. Hel1_85]|uniref:peptidylprolyl isomerase n=1 Tax=Polaribacter sp. Hel1_85 TaxID=1250005 RepID=UPI00052BF251|nr:peptidylprolyl isomerase [Polaribacter sp. Hel1_85]KGL61887.1 PpiC-type peptidyl-prolyl cis-trans isomerase [Polaribacter sp. Hel1_85]